VRGRDELSKRLPASRAAKEPLASMRRAIATSTRCRRHCRSDQGRGGRTGKWGIGHQYPFADQCTMTETPEALAPQLPAPVV